MIHSVLLAPKALKAQANRLGHILGYGPDSYSVPLYPTKIKTTIPTFYGGCSLVTDAFVVLIAEAKKGIIPSDLLILGYSKESVKELVSQLVIDFSYIEEEPLIHFERVLAAMKLSRYPYYGD
jgi:hypothetical protein